MNKNLPRTEQSLFNNIFIDHLEDFDALKLMLKEQQDGLKLMEKNLKDIRVIVDKIYERLSNNDNGRLIYIGAGTSGRIGVQDGVELYPTFGWPKSRIDFVLAGGIKALLSSVENSEDSLYDARTAIKKLDIKKFDSVIALAASGDTPFTVEALKCARKNDALAIAISNNKNGNILNYSDHKIILDSGPEVVTGSTRLKAGTMQKVCLNMISTLLMIKFGNVKNGNMVNLITNNKKLIERKKEYLKS